MTDRFELLEQLGKGGMGTVWKARDRTTGELVAVKVLHEQFASDPAFVARFEREVDITRRIDSPYVVKMLGYGSQGGRPYACMEYVPGESLRDVIHRGGPINWPETRRVLGQVTQGLQAAHEAGIIHRDVKPSNILVAIGGIAKLVDFGIAKAADMTALTGSSTTMGTAAYTAPEGESSPAADLYAFGCTAYEMLAGVQPFTGESPAQVLIKHLRDAPDLSRIPQEAREVIGWLLEKDPKERLNSASALLRALRLADDRPHAWDAGRLTQAAGDPSFTPVPPPPRNDGARPDASSVPPLPVPRSGGVTYWSPPTTPQRSLEARAYSPRYRSPVSSGFPDSIAGRRLVSALLDYTTVTLILLLINNGALLAAQPVLSFTWLLCIGGAFLWEAGNGKSPGKALLGLVVIGPDDAVVGPGRSLARTLLKFLSIITVLPLLIEFFAVVFTRGSQRLCDKLTGTRVVRTRDLVEVDD